jgi:hypothetical protein
MNSELRTRVHQLRIASDDFDVAEAIRDIAAAADPAAIPMGTLRPKRSIPYLKLPKSVKGVVDVARAIVTAMTRRQESFGLAPSALGEVAREIERLVDAERAAAGREPGALMLRESRRRDLVTELQRLRARVNVVAAADPPRSVAIIESAGMVVR